MCTFLGPKVKYAICDRTPPQLHTKCSLYECTSLYRSKIFKRNWNISIRSSAIEFWLIPGVPPLGGVGGWMGVGLCQDVWGSPHTCACMCACTHACACAYMYKHDNFMQMAAPIRKSWGIPYDIIAHARAHMHACMCAHAHVHVCGASPQIPWQSPTPIHQLPPPKGGDPQNQ